MNQSYAEIDSPEAQPSASAEEGGEDEEEEEEEDDDGATHVASSNGLLITAVDTLESLQSTLREIGGDALCWQLSSAKPGNGVEQIRDDSIETYWQSDGTAQPHWIQVCFQRRVAISHVCLYLDFTLDESYTPKKIRIEAGMTNQDLLPAMHPASTEVEFHEPNGWCIIPLSSPPDPLDGDDDTSTNLVRAHLFRISVLSMYQNGRDTHIRQVKLFGPRTSQPNRIVPRQQLQQKWGIANDDDDIWEETLIHKNLFGTIR